MKTNAAAAASAACAARRSPEEVMSAAVECLRKSVESIIADTEPGEERDALIRESTAQAKRFIEKSFAADVAGDEADLDDEETEIEDDDETGNDHHASKVADLLVEAGTFPDRARALAHLLHHKDGQALLDRMKKGKTMKRDSWQDIAKDHGVVAIAKMINADQDAHGISEHELVDLIGKHDPKPGESTAQTFARNYQANIELRKAVQIAKATMLVTPVFVGGEDARAVNDPKDALGQINQLVEEQRKRSPEMSAAQAFARVYADNPGLAAAERRQNRPTGHPSYPPASERERVR